MQECYQYKMAKKLERRFILSVEETSLLIIGLFFGWLAGKGVYDLLLLIPLVIFAVFIFEYIHYKRTGKLIEG